MQRLQGEEVRPGQRAAASGFETHAVCSQCGKETTVPFKPTQGRPVFCKDCFKQRRQSLGPVPRAR